VAWIATTTVISVFSLQWLGLSLDQGRRLDLSPRTVSG
jgi:hypothetical protein